MGTWVLWVAIAVLFALLFWVMRILRRFELRIWMIENSLRRARENGQKEAAAKS